MSILIKGMEMPKENRVTLQISADGAVYVVNRCRITTETYTTDAVPIPPHGRLIDADAFLKFVNNTMILTDGFINTVNALIDGEPTVVEAEDGEP